MMFERFYVQCRLGSARALARSHLTEQHHYGELPVFQTAALVTITNLPSIIRGIDIALLHKASSGIQNITLVLLTPSSAR